MDNHISKDNELEEKNQKEKIISLRLKKSKDNRVLAESKDYF